MDGAVIRYRNPVDREYNVALFQMRIRSAAGYYKRDQHSALIVLHAEVAPVADVFQGVGKRAQRGKSVISAVFDVLKKMPDNGNGYHESDIVGIRAGLKGHTDDPAVLNDRASAVPRIDGRVGLYHEKRYVAHMGVFPDLDSGDDAFGDGYAAAANRIAVGRDL